jgi:hypothetical protein
MDWLKQILKVISEKCAESFLSTLSSLCGTINKIVNRMDKKDVENKEKENESKIEKVVDKGTIKDLLDL